MSAPSKFPKAPRVRGHLDRRERWFRALLDFFVGNLESEKRHRYALEVEQGRFLFAVPVTEETRADVLAAVLARGAS